MVNTFDSQCLDIMDSLADALFIVDKFWKITHFNKAAEQISGWKREEVIGKECSEIFSSNICKSGCVLAKCIENSEPIINKLVFIKNKNNKSIPISISASALKDAMGNVMGGIEIFRDMTNQLQMELILDSITDGVFTVDKDWKITSFNTAAENITGYKADDALGQTCSDIFKSSICGENCAVGICIKTHCPVLNRSITIQKKDGKRIPVKINASPLFDSNGEIFGAVETFRDISEITSLRKQVTQRFSFADIVTKSKNMIKILEILPDISRSDSNVLILGESGTGKELIARAIHGLSKRHRDPFIAINCGAIPDTLLESELFGYKAGAFTDAKKDREGKVAAAENGTLFLDEIGDISHSLQVKLLRFLQERVYEPLGSNKTIKANVRVIAATNKDLKDIVTKGEFREDLFYRLNVANILLPPLRERKDDIPLLVEHFIKKFNTIKEKAIEGITPEAMDILLRYDYPGNIRELENIIEYTFIVCHHDLITPRHFPENLVQKTGNNELNICDEPMTIQQAEKILIKRSLQRNNGKIMATCRELGIKSKDTLRKKIREYEIEMTEEE